MANTDKDIVITPNRGSSTSDPTMRFTGGNATVAASVNVSMYADGTLSFDGTAGQLFSITNSLTGTLFSVNDVSGIPSIEVTDAGIIRLAQYNGNVGIGTATPSASLHVQGNAIVRTRTALGSNATIKTGSTDPIATIGTYDIISGNLTPNYWTGAFYAGNQYTHTATTSAYINDLFVGPGIPTTSTNPISQFYGINSQPINRGSGNVTDIAAINSSGVHGGSGTATSVGGIYTSASVTSTGSATTAWAGWFNSALTSSGNITTNYGIQITSPIASGVGKITGTNYGLYISAQNTAAVSGTGYNLYSAGATTRNVFDGSVGIGTITPGYALDVRSTGAVRSNLQSTLASGFSAASYTAVNPGGTVTLGIDGQSSFGYAQYAGIIAHSGAYPLVFATGSAEKMRVDANGNLGIGTTAPSNRLSVFGGNIQIDTGSNNYGILFSDGTFQKTAATGSGVTVNTGTTNQLAYYSGTSAISGLTTGTGVNTALGVNTGSAGAFVVNGGVLGTPSSGTLTNCTFPTLNQNTTGYAAGIAGGALGQLHYQTGANASGFVGVGTSGWVLTGAGSALPQWTQATNANTASTIVQRDASGNFSAGTITATLSGSATSAGTATTATTATNIASGTTGQIPYQSGAGATAFVGVGTASYALVGNGAAAPSWLQYTNANTASTIVQRDASGNFSAGTITASLTGTASTATNVAGGALGQLHYQTGSGTTGFVGVGTSGWVLTGAGSALPQWTQATNANTASTIVQRDASGNFSAGTITATLSGSATSAGTATTATTATNIASGTTGQIPYQSGAGATAFVGVGTASYALVGNGAAAPSWLQYTNANTASTIVQRDASGNFSAGTITATLTGTASTATNVAGGALGQLHYQTGSGTTGFVGVGTSGWVLTGAGSALPQWTQAVNTNTASTIVQRDASGNFSAGTITASLTGTASTATNVAGGALGQLHYQTGSGTTGFVGVGTSGWFLTGAGSALPQWTQVVPVANGGTGLSTGTSGGILYYSAAGTLASSGLLTQFGVVYGGGAGATPVATAAGTTGQLLTATTSGAPTWGLLDISLSAPDLSYKKIVDAATVGTNITLTGGAPSTLDGVTLALNSRVLVKDQTAPAENGIYYVTTLGTGANGTWTRSVDADATTDIDAATVAVSRGTVNGGLRFVTYFKGSDTLGTTAMYWNRLVDYAASAQGPIPTTGIGIDISTPSSTVNFATGSIADLALNSFWGRTITATGASTYTRAATVYISGAPTASTNATFTNSYALYVAGGLSAFQGNVSVAGSITSTGSTGNITGVNNLSTVTVTATGAITGTAFIPTGSTIPANGMYLGSTNAVTFATNSTERMRITTNGGMSFGSSGTAYGSTGQILTSAGDAAPTWGFLDLSISAPDSSYKKIADAATIGTNITLAGGAPSTLDGVTLALNSRVLVKDQTAPAENGIYYVTTLGTGANGTWTRSVDADASTDMDGATVAISKGTVNGGRRYITYFKGTDTLGTTAMYWNRLVDAYASSQSAILTTASGLDIAVGGDTVNLATGSIADLALNSFTGRTITATGASTYTRAATMYISGAPTASTNATFTNSYALYVAGGATAFVGGTVTLGANAGTGGQITFNGSTSGSCALRVAAAAGTSTIFQLPATNGTNGWVLTTDGSGNTSWAAASSGATITDDNATNITQYPVMARVTSGTFSTAYTASTDMYFNPSSGTLNAVIFNSLSDIAVKENVLTIDNALGTINNMRGVGFNWKRNGKKSYGVIAQELEQILPELVDINEDDGNKSVNYSAIIGFLIEAVKDLNTKVNSLTTKIDDLTGNK